MPQLGRAHDDDVTFDVDGMLGAIADISDEEEKFFPDPHVQSRMRGAGLEKTIFFIRHAEGGCGDMPLIDRAVKQMKMTHQKYSRALKTVEVVLTSPAVACMETSLRLFDPEKIIVDPYLIHASYNEGQLYRKNGLKMLTEKDTWVPVLRQYNRMWKGNRTISDAIGDGWEHDPDHMGKLALTKDMRWEHFMDKLMDREEAVIAVVTHANILDHVLGSHAGKGSIHVRLFNDGAFREAENHDEILESETASYLQRRKKRHRGSMRGTLAAQ